MGAASSKRRKSHGHWKSNQDAVRKIQRWYRIYLARMEMHRQQTWKIFKTLENIQEKECMSVYRFFDDVVNMMGSKPGTAFGKRPGYLQEKITRGGATSSQMHIPEESIRQYSGNYLKAKLVKADINRMIDMISKEKYFALHPGMICDILKLALPIIKSMPNVSYIYLSENQKVVIMGKICGHIHDLILMLHQNGLPSKDNIYIINGDFIGAGGYNIEVLALVLICFIVFPNCVFLCRGCNEDSLMSYRNNLLHELNFKYTRNASAIYDLVIAFFRVLPLAMVVNNSLFIIHGGVTDKVNMKSIRTLERHRFISILRPTMSDSVELLNDWRYLVNIVWCRPEPDDDSGLYPPGPIFDHTCLDALFGYTHLEKIVRCKDCPRDGLAISHGERVMSICSCSNYYASTSNKGCYLICDAKGNINIAKYMVARKYNNEITFRQSLYLQEEQALHDLCVELRKHRFTLENKFKEHDLNHTGTLSKEVFIKCMEEVSKLKISWRVFLTRPTYDIQTNIVYYNEALRTIDDPKVILDCRKRGRPIDLIIKNENSLKTLFFILDKQNLGSINLKDFQEALAILKKRIPSEVRLERIYDYAKHHDENDDGFIDFKEFIEAFDAIDPYQF